MFEAGKRYKIKTIDEILKIPGAEIMDYYINVDGEPSFVLKEMGEYCGKIITATNTSKYIQAFTWTWSSYMVTEVSKKLRLLQAIKDFK